VYTLDQKHKKHSGSLYAVAFSSKLNLLFTGGADKIVASWNLETQENTPLSIKTDSAVLNLRYLNDEKH
jgi:WD40 repeat protein